ncbi:Methyltransferase domain-containing protein [Saccharopolyspora antimicrobica]|uniref:Methyltransferase domain-containing protein n=1 Tax=Saccharopolyspora antimicrobica TaxID=455193 RepID=A0A1I4YZ70_9PSEU|nr:methyltransferase domain-containing protein [Saccharopolyspora antimicrobica]RKT82867.1 methyltransferase family protein [Saccharopolyspora antimicrobica]SFN43237.1 Methyltransferase domain-containing protein [Saccharopolyspora antimicrobica]
MSTENLIEILDRFDSLPGSVRLRERSYQLLPAGGLVADIGCGAGRAVGELRERGVTAIGLDVDGEMVAAARERLPGVDFRLADAGALPFADGELAGYRAERVFHAIADPAAALAEARRALAPGGRIVLLGQDWEAILIDSDDMATTRAAVQARLRTVPQPHAARQYRNLLLDSGFRDVTVEVHTGFFTDGIVLPMLLGLAGAARGVLTDARVESWIAEQRRRAETDRLSCAIPMFLAAATNP